VGRGESRTVWTAGEHPFRRARTLVDELWGQQLSTFEREERYRSGDLSRRLLGALGFNLTGRTGLPSPGLGAVLPGDAARVRRNGLAPVLTADGIATIAGLRERLRAAVIGHACPSEAEARLLWERLLAETRLAAAATRDAELEWLAQRTEISPASVGADAWLEAGTSPRALDLNERRRLLVDLGLRGGHGSELLGAISELLARPRA
jgi:hypothetical protein